MTYEQRLSLARTYLNEIDLSKIGQMDPNTVSILCALEQITNVLEHFFDGADKAMEEMSTFMNEYNK